MTPLKHLSESERELLKLAEAATPGPWQQYSNVARNYAGAVWKGPGRGIVSHCHPWSPPNDQTIADAAFIAASRAAVPALLTEVSRLRGVLAMGLQLTDSGNHDGKTDACPTCHWANVARAALAPTPAAGKEG